MDKKNLNDLDPLYKVVFKNKTHEEFIQDLMSMDVNYSYDYEELLFELKSDLAEGLIQDTVYTEWETIEGYPRPVMIDYYYSLSDVPDGTKVSESNINELIKFLESENKLFK